VCCGRPFIGLSGYVKVGEAEKESRGLASGLSRAALELARLDAVGFEGRVVFLVVMGGEGGAEGLDGEREVVEGEQASPPCDGRLEVVEASVDVGLGHPERE
jgi:hypothetical protein